MTEKQQALAPITITVHGTPGPQGSKRYLGKGIMVESSKLVKPWREAVVWSVLKDHPFGGRQDPFLFRGAVSVDVVFSLVKPKVTKKGARPDKKPDLDKLLRSTFDGLKTAGMYADDSRIVSVTAHKRYAGDADALAVPGAVIFIEAAK